MTYIKTIAVLFICIFMASCYKYQSETADLIVHNAKIYTMDNAFSTAEAMAIVDGKIIAIGPEHEIRNKYYSKNTVDAMKRPIYPGFIDAHSHFMMYAKSLGEINLEGSKSWDEVLERTLKSQEEDPKNWILGRGWDQNLWTDKKFPTNKKLDSLFPDTPVLLWRIDAHAAISNSKALELAGITSETMVEGGEIILEELHPSVSLSVQSAELKGQSIPLSGQSRRKPTGLLMDMAIEEVKKVIPELSMEEWKELLKKAEANCFSVGLTSVSEAMMEAEHVKIIEQLQDSNKLKIKLYGMLAPSRENKKRFFRDGPLQTNYLSISAFKYFADGALGSRGAKLKEPYSDDPRNTGIYTSDSAYLHQEAENLYKNGFQMATHCIGDAANSMVLDIYVDVLQGTNDRRWRIEHAQVVSPEDIPKFGEYNIIPSVQPTHATSDMKWAVERLGSERLKNAYALKDLLEENGLIALGTDFPIEDISPIKTFYTAVFRKKGTGKPEKGFQMENALSREEALHGMTIWAAIANFEEEKKGSLEVGKSADFVILDRDLMLVAKEHVLDTKVIATYVNGEKAYPQ